MCLDSVQKNVEPWDTGYKVFGVLSVASKGLKLMRCCAGSIARLRPESKWIHEKDYRGEGGWDNVETIYCYGLSYPKGWHVFQTLESARKYLGFPAAKYETIRKVKCRGAVATGLQEGLKTGVFKEIFIIPKEDK